MANYNLYARVTGKDTDFELKTKVDSLSVIESLAGVCIDASENMEKPLLTAEEAYKYLAEGKTYRWFRKHYTVSSNEINGYKRWFKRKGISTKKSTPTESVAGIDLYAKINGAGACIELRGKVASLDSVLMHLTGQSKVEQPEAKKEEHGKPELTYDIFKKHNEKPYDWFMQKYETSKSQINGFRFAYRRFAGSADTGKPKLTRKKAAKLIEQGKDYDWIAERFDCSIHQWAGYKAWLTRTRNTKK